MSGSGPSKSSRITWAALPPAIKLTAWLAAVAGLALSAQLVAWAAGFDFNILAQSKAGRGVLLALALATLMAVMAADRRPASDYGLVISDRWLREWLSGFGLGVLTFCVFCAVAIATGGLAVHNASPASEWALAAVKSLTAFPVAVSQQIIFSGFLLSVFRGRLGRLGSAAVVSLLFAVLSKIHDPATVIAEGQWRLVLGMFLVSMLLALVRLYYGTIVVSAGLLAGWIMIRRLIGKAGVLVTTGGPTSWWLSPVYDPRQAPAMWLALGLGIGMFVMLLRRRGEAHVEQTAGMAASFKRIAPLSNVCMFAPLDLWIARLWHARFAVGLAYVPRLAAIIVVSAINTLLSLPERVLAPLLLRGRGLPDPVFIVGVHRSGTTHLHNLLALDARFVTPRAYQIINPHGFMSMGWLVTPLLAAFLPWKRPMDSVRFNAFSPNEEEFALMGMTRVSPYWGITFPRQGREYDRFIFTQQMTDRERRNWKRQYLTFLRKLVFWSGRPPLLKNPHNTARVCELARMFPRAKFIHIHRHPYAVYRSNQHMEKEGHCVAQLHDPDPRVSYSARFLDSYRAMEDAFYRDAAELSADQAAEVRFDELERDPIGVVRAVYRQLGLAFDESFQQRLQDYLFSLGQYQKNRFHSLSEQEKQLVYDKLAPHFERWGYDPDLRPRTAEAA